MGCPGDGEKFSVGRVAGAWGSSCRQEPYESYSWGTGMENLQRRASARECIASTGPVDGLRPREVKRNPGDAAKREWDDWGALAWSNCVASPCWPPTDNNLCDMLCLIFPITTRSTWVKLYLHFFHFLLLNFICGSDHHWTQQHTLSYRGNSIFLSHDFRRDSPEGSHLEWHMDLLSFTHSNPPGREVNRLLDLKPIDPYFLIWWSLFPYDFSLSPSALPLLR